MGRKTSSFKFRRTDRIGAAGAEEDREFLDSCFVDTGDLALLENLADNRLIILGRTGTGKTALLQQLARNRSERIRSFRFCSNRISSSVLRSRRVATIS